MANKQDIIDALNEEYNETLVWDAEDDWNLGVREGIRTAINCINCLWDQHEDVAPVVHGHLIFHKDELDGMIAECSVCHVQGMLYGNYCVHCGAKLDEEDDDSAID